MKIVSENKASWIEFNITGRETLYYPSVRLSVRVVDEDFAGAYDQIWVSAEEMEKFSADLRLCEQSRKGKASLSGVSPDELRLAIEQIDGWGHFGLQYTLGRFSRSPQEAYVKSVCGGFDLDSSTFKALVDEFAHFYQ